MLHERLRRTTTLAAGTLAAGIVLAACGGAGGPGGEGSAGSGGGEGETTSITVGYFPLVHTATAVHAAETGIFEDAGLDVELEQTGGGAQTLPSLIAGEYDIIYGNYTSAVLSAQQGLPVRIIAGNDVGAEDHGIMVNEDSPLEAPADLEGQTVAVNNLENIGTVAVKSIVEEAGVDPSTVDLVEMPYPDMQAALDRGDVDAIWQVEPFKASSLGGGDRQLFQLFSGPVEDMPVAGWQTTAQFTQENPEVVAAFQEALATSADELQGDRERLVELVPTYTEVPAEVVEQVALPRWDASINVEQLTKMSDLMLEYGIIDEVFDARTMVAESG